MGVACKIHNGKKAGPPSLAYPIKRNLIVITTDVLQLTDGPFVRRRHLQVLKRMTRP